MAGASEILAERERSLQAESATTLAQLSAERDELRADNSKLRTQNRKLQEELCALRQEVQELQRRLGLNSSNSGPAGSADTAARRCGRVPARSGR